MSGGSGNSVYSFWSVGLMRPRTLPSGWPISDQRCAQKAPDRVIDQGPYRDLAARTGASAKVAVSALTRRLS